jgi:hypothetical protein
MVDIPEDVYERVKQGIEGATDLSEVRHMMLIRFEKFLELEGCKAIGNQDLERALNISRVSHNLARAFPEDFPNDMEEKARNAWRAYNILTGKSLTLEEFMALGQDEVMAPIQTGVERYHS